MGFGKGLAWLGLAVALLVVGCAKPAPEGREVATSGQSGTASSTADASTGASQAVSPEAATPEEAVRRFLEAVRTGDDRVAEAMFTTVARERIKELDIQVAPRGSDTAKYEVGTAEYLPSGGAQVACKWTDLDHDGTARTDEMTWILRKEPEGWRVAGMAATVFEGEDPLRLDFENPKETLQKLDTLRDEIARRSATPGDPPKQAEQSADSIRR